MRFGHKHSREKGEDHFSFQVGQNGRTSSRDHPGHGEETLLSERGSQSKKE